VNCNDAQPGSRAVSQSEERVLAGKGGKSSPTSVQATPTYSYEEPDEKRCVK
jgi:hypothetical protein